MSSTQPEADWRSIAQAEDFARAGATDEAVARARTTRDALEEALDAADDDAARAPLRVELERARARLTRYGVLDAATRGATRERERSYLARERRALHEPLAGPPPEEPDR